MQKNKKIFAICDLDEHYVVRLTNYLSEKKMTPFEILAFTSLDSLAAYAGSHPIEILLISREAMCSRVKDLNVARTLILTGDEELELPESRASGDISMTDLPEENPDSGSSPGKGSPETSKNSVSSSVPEGYRAIRKYQSSENIAREVMNYYSGESMPSAKDLQKSGVIVYAVYSPIARCGKTLFSLTLSEILGEKARTLYLNMENYSGFEALFGRTYRQDLTDLVYLSRKNEGSLPLKLESAIQTMGSADYIPPAFFPGDLKEIDPGDWVRFLSSVSGIMKYQTIVLDIGTDLSGVSALLNLASHIYMPVLPDPLSRAKLSQYEKDMEALSMQPLMDRTVRLYLPEVHPQSGGAGFLESLLSSNLGAYTRKLLKEEKQAQTVRT